MIPQGNELIVVRDQLVSVQPSDLLDDRLIRQKARDFFTVFGSLKQLKKLKVTQARKDNLAEKRHEKKNAESMPTISSDVVWVGPSAPRLSTEETVRIASISNPAVSSSGGQHLTATQEKETDQFANSFCATTLRLLYLNGNRVWWAEGRAVLPVLEWRHRLYHDRRSLTI